MANEEQLGILRQGFEAWKAWRQNHPDIGPDLRGANLVGTHLRWADLMGADLHGASLHGADLAEASRPSLALDKALSGECPLKEHEWGLAARMAARLLRLAALLPLACCGPTPNEYLASSER